MESNEPNDSPNPASPSKNEPYEVHYPASSAENEPYELQHPASPAQNEPNESKTPDLPSENEQNESPKPPKPASTSENEPNESSNPTSPSENEHNESPKPLNPTLSSENEQNESSNPNSNSENEPNESPSRTSSSEAEPNESSNATSPSENEPNESSNPASSSENEPKSSNPTSTSENESTESSNPSSPSESIMGEQTLDDLSTYLAKRNLDAEETHEQEESATFGDVLIKLDESNKQYEIAKTQFISALNSMGLHSHVEAIHRKAYSKQRKKVKLPSFLDLLKNMKEICGGDAIVRSAWYGGSKDDICNIMTHRFANILTDGIYGRGIYLSPAKCPINSVISTVADEDGLRHLLLCRVILGKVELIHPGTVQCRPSSEDFDSGVDNLESPMSYIIWKVHASTHILPELVISFRAPIEDSQESPANSPVHCDIRIPLDIPIEYLAFKLSKVLPADTMNLIEKHYSDHRENKITEDELQMKVVQVVQAELLVHLVKSRNYDIYFGRRDYASTENSRIC